MSLNGRLPGESCRRHVVQGCVRPTLIVVGSPCLDSLLGFGQGFKPIYVQVFVAERAIERFNMAIIRRCTWPTEVDIGLVVVSPQVEQQPRDFAVIVDQKARGAPRRAANRPRASTQALSHFDRQCLVRKNINDGQGAKFVAGG